MPQAILFKKCLGYTDSSAVATQSHNPETGETQLIGCVNTTVTDDGAVEKAPVLSTVYTHSAPLTRVSAGLRLFKKPTAAGTLNLTVIRLPLADVTTRTSPEIHPYLHVALIPWIKYRIYGNQDSELFNGNRSAEMLARFEAKFGTRPADQADIFEAMQIPPYELPGLNLCTADYL